MEFVFEGAEEVAKVADSETSDVESSQDEVEGEPKPPPITTLNPF